MMTQLDASAPSLWEGLAILSRCRLEFETPTGSFTTTIDTSAAHLIDQHLVIPAAGITLDTSEFDDVFASNTPDSIQMVSNLRRLGITLIPEQEEAIHQHHLLTTTFSQETLPEEFQLEGVQEPGQCVCCLEIGQRRVQTIAQNPLTAILAYHATVEIPLIISAGNDDGSITLVHTPSTLLQQDDFLVSESDKQQIKINIRHLHAMRLSEEIVDGIPHQSLALLSSHGNITCQFSAPSSQVEADWHQILKRQDHGYEIHDLHSYSSIDSP